MKWIFPATLLTLASGCSTVSGVAICDGSQAARDAHTEALLLDGGDESVMTGAYLLGLLDTACAG